MMKVYKDKMLQDSSILFMLNMLASMLNYLCQLFLAKVLSVESFGTINTIFSFLLIIGVPGTTLTMVVAKKYAEKDDFVSEENKTEYISSLLRNILALSVIVFFVCLIIGKPLSMILAINDIVVLFLAFLLGALGFFQPIYSGVFSGNKYFILVGIYSLLIPIYKIISILVAQIMVLHDNARLYIILLVMVLGNVVVAIYGHKKTKGILGSFTIFGKSKSKLFLKKEDVNTLILNVCLMLYMNIDLLAVRFRGNPEESGLYSSVLLFGRIIYYFSTTLGTILLPMVTTVKDNHKETVKLLNKTLGLMLMFAIVCVTAINGLGNFILDLLFGNVYLGAQKYILYVGLISIALSLCTILINYLVGVEKTVYATIIMVTLNVLIIVLVGIVRNIQLLLLGIGILGLFCALALYYLSIKNSKRVKFT